MTDADHPTALSRPHVIDMFYAALTTLPHGGAGNSEPQADADLAIDPALGSSIASLLGRLYHGGEELTVTKKQPNGGKRTYQIRSLRHEIRGGEGPHRPDPIMVSVLRVAPYVPKPPKQHSGKPNQGGSPPSIMARSTICSCEQGHLGIPPGPVPRRPVRHQRSHRTHRR